MFSTVGRKSHMDSKQTPLWGGLFATRHSTVPRRRAKITPSPEGGEGVILARRLGTVEWRLYRGLDRVAALTT